MKSTKIINRRASFDYQLFDRFEAGLVLSGAEVKAIRAGHANLSQAHAKFVGPELFLVNAAISVPGKKDYRPTQSRKLLLHKHQLISLSTTCKAKKLTLIPLKLYTKGRLLKLEFALAKPKRKHQKRAALKKRDLQRDLEHELKAKD